MARKKTLREQIQEHGDRRRLALAEADAELEEILKLAPKAIADEDLSVLELSKVGAVSRPTLYKRLDLKDSAAS